ncbi:phage tail tape measure protein [Salinicola socius]|uniref:Phage tail tape measure protein domain-containing protein n=1 Tax=Salinicola socius TaxID=404433 RepID=A0A1Q8SUG5_9GAMM|nr:hypothetical protein [Salinicola socius]OLO05100.1 hypothetical protein BTW07_05660 [Salinicola socius]
MAGNLKLDVLLRAIDKATGPLKKITQGSGETAEALKASREQLKTLERAQKDMRGFRQLKEQSRESARALQQQQDEIRDLSRRMNEAGADTAALGRERKAAIQQARKLSERYEDEQRKLRDLRSSMTRVEGVTGSYADQQRELQRRIRSTNEEIEKQQHGLREVARRQKAAADAAKKYHRTIGRANNMTGAGMTGVAAGGGGVFALTNQAFSAEMSGARLASQFGEDTDRGVVYQDVIADVYGTGRGADMQQITDAVAAVGAAFGSLDDISQENLTDLTKRALTLSDVFGTDVAESVQTAQIMVKNGLAKDANAAMDLIGAGFQRVSVEMRDELPEILHEYSTNFRSLGFDGKQAMGLLVDAAGQGKFALDKTGDALKEFTIRGSDMSKASVSAYESVGLNAQAMSDAIASGGPTAREALQQTAKAIFAIEDPAKRANTAIALFGTPIEDLSVDQIPKFLEGLTGAGEGLGDVTGTIDEMAKTLGDNAMSALKRVQRALSGELMRVLRDVRDDIIAVSDAVVTWIKANPELVSWLIKITAAIAAVVAVSGALTLALASLLGPFAATRWLLEMVGLRAKGADSLLGKLAKGGIKLLGGAFKWLGRIVAVVGRAFLLNPIGLAVTAIAGAAYLIYRNWDGIAAFFADRWRDVKAAFDDGVGGVMRLLINWNPLGLVYKGVIGILRKMGVEVPESIATLGDAIVNGLGAAWEGITSLWDWFKDAPGKAIDYVVSLVSDWDLMGQLEQKWDEAIAYLKSLPSRMWSAGKDVAVGLGEGIKSGASAVADRAGDMADGAIKKARELLRINSPSRAFREIGGYTVEGFNQGLDQKREEPVRRVAEIAKRMTQAGAGIAIGAASLPVAAMPGFNANHDVALDTRPPIAAPASGGVQITIGDINVHPAPGMDEQALARYVAAEVQRALAAAQRDAAARTRRNLYDND